MTRSERPADPSAARPLRAQPPDAWQATRAQTVLATRFLGDHEDDLAPGRLEVGRQTGENLRELFVSCAPDLALQQQFEHLQSEFIAVHDIGTHSSRKLLSGLAAASGRAVQQLLVRRQGYGTLLATLEFVELPGADGTTLRMYSTEVDADTVARHGLARVLLGFSRLGVIMVGDLPAHAVAAALQPFQASMAQGPWPNRQLLLLPLASGSTLANLGAYMANGARVDVRTTPVVNRPSDAWEFIQRSWARLSEPGDAVTRARPARVPSAMRPMPAVPRVKAPAQPTVPVPLPAVALPPAKHGLERYVAQLIELPGMVSCCIFDVASGLEVARAGARPAAADLAMHGKSMLAAIGASSRGMGLGQTLPEVAITLGSHHLLIRELPGQPGLALHAALDKANSNLTLVRLQVQRLDALLDAPAKQP